MISVQIIGVEKVVANLKRIPENIIPAVKTDIGRLCLRNERLVKEEKLSGQVLHVQTGRLRRSIHSEVTATRTDVTGIVGTNVAYAAAHEYGFDGTVSVRGHLREIKKGFKVPVRPYSKHLHLPERSFLRSAFKELTPEIRTRLEDIIRRIIGGGR